MSSNSHERARKLYAARWADYVRYGLDTTVTAPIALVIDARTEEEAQHIATAIAGGRFDISRKWWPFGRRWRVMAATRPLLLARASVDEWFDGVLHLLQCHDADFVNWVPLEPARCTPAA
jgi:hypothetical protein